MVITKKQHTELKQLKNRLAALLLEIDSNDVQDLLNIEEVGAYAAELFNYSIDEVISESRTKDLILCKQFIIKFCREELRLKSESIADYIKKDRTSIIYNYSKFNKIIEAHIEIKKQYEQFKLDLL